MCYLWVALVSNIRVTTKFIVFVCSRFERYRLLSKHQMTSCSWHILLTHLLSALTVSAVLSNVQALLEVVDSGAKNMEIAIVRFEKPIEV